MRLVCQVLLVKFSISISNVQLFPRVYKLLFYVVLCKVLMYYICSACAVDEVANSRAEFIFFWRFFPLITTNQKGFF